MVRVKYSANHSIKIWQNTQIYRPVIIYRMELMDKDGNQVGYWKDSIRQVQNDDKSWW